MKIKDINVCSRLGDERKRLNLNQSKVAEYCGVSVKTVGRWEKSIPIPADKLSLLAQLGYDITYVLTNMRLAPQAQGLDEASKVWNVESGSEAARRKSDIVSDDHAVWLGILETLAGGDQERLKQIGLALIGYSQASTEK